MAEFPALPLFTDAVVADCNHLSDDEFGLYMRILILMWRSPECEIPAQAEWLEKRLKRPITVIGPILAEFCMSDGNFYTQKRLLKEFLYVRKHAKKQSVAAKSRWIKEKHACQSDAKPMPDACQIDAPTPHSTPPTPTPLKKVPPTPKDEHGPCVDLYNEMAERAGLPKCQVLTDKRKAALRLRLKECGGPEGWKDAIAKVEASSFLTGGNNNGWRANFDFLMQPSSFTKLMEGSYDNRKSTIQPKKSAHDAMEQGFADAAIAIDMAQRRERGE